MTKQAAPPNPLSSSPLPKRYNALLAAVSSSLAALARALRGQEAMGPELEAAAAAVALNRVPAAWARAAYPSRKPLAAWLADLARRVAFVSSWLTDGAPRRFWLPGLSRPQGFVTALLQDHARRRGLPVDGLVLAQRVLAPAERAALEQTDRRRETRAAAEEGTSGGADGGGGALVYGLYLEGARWDDAAGCLAEAAPGEALGALPTVHLLPVERGAGRRQQQQQLELEESPAAANAVATTGPTTTSPTTTSGPSVYPCPLYRTSDRSAFVMHLDLPLAAGGSPAAWLLQGVAALCSLDDQEGH
jgi:dynein heavy chain